MDKEKNHLKVEPIKLEIRYDLEKFLSVENLCFTNFYELKITKLCTELAHDPKIKVVALLEFYNFALGYIAMQTSYDIVQPRSNIPLENDDLLYIYDLET